MSYNNRRRRPSFQDRVNIGTMQAAFAAEGAFDGNSVVVPDDFFTRLNAKLNPPGQTLGLREQCDKMAATGGKS